MFGGDVVDQVKYRSTLAAYFNSVHGGPLGVFLCWTRGLRIGPPVEKGPTRDCCATELEAPRGTELSGM